MDLNETVLEHMQSPEHADLVRHHGEITVHLELADDRLPVKASATHVRKALMNLISNAFEAVGGKGEVTLSTANRYVDRAIRGDERGRPGEYAVLTVSDSGPGIPEDIQKRIFEPFYTKKAMGRSGTGLGLAVVWNILQDHEGYVEVQSSGGGTSFDLYFPITREGCGYPRVTSLQRTFAAGGSGSWWWTTTKPSGTSPPASSRASAIRSAP